MSTCGKLEKTSLHHHQHHLKLFRGQQFANRIQRRKCRNVVSESSLLSSRHSTVLLHGYTLVPPNYEPTESGIHKIFCNVRFSITFRSTLRSLNDLEIRFRTQITLTCALLHACYTYRSSHTLRLYQRIYSIVSDRKHKTNHIRTVRFLNPFRVSFFKSRALGM